MIRYLLPLIALIVSGCQLGASAGTFFGTTDPCIAGSVVHAGFVTVATSQPKVAKYARHERVAYAAFTAQCSDGSLNKFTIRKALDAYSAAVAEWKNPDA